jgi:hypothetical protein
LDHQNYPGEGHNVAKGSDFNWSGLQQIIDEAVAFEEAYFQGDQWNALRI